MYKFLLKGVLSGIAAAMLENYRHLSVQLLKIEAAKSYLYGVRMARRYAVGLLGMFLLVGLIGVGVVLFHAGLFILLPWSVKAKAALGLVLGGLYMAGGATVLHAAMGERKWMDRSGASLMLHDAAAPDKKH